MYFTVIISDRRISYSVFVLIKTTSFYIPFFAVTLHSQIDYFQYFTSSVAVVVEKGNGGKRNISFSQKLTIQL